MQATPQQLTELILAGGQSRRFLSADKGLIDFRGRPMIAHVTEILRNQVETVIISANREQPQYHHFADQVLNDCIGEQWGPLAGIYTGLQAATTPYVIVATCDQPLLPADYVSRMAESADPATIVMASDCHRDHFLNLLLPIAVADSVQNYLLAGGRRVQTWLEQAGYEKIQFPAEVLDSINDPANLQRQQQKFDNHLNKP